MTDAETFLLALAGDHVEPEHRIILAGFIGDPNTAGTHAWRPRPYYPGNEIVLNERANGYCTIAAFGRAEDNTFRRRTGYFAYGLALMVDDVGTKVQKRDDWPPATCVIETSPENFQYWYFLREKERDVATFDAVIRSFIKQELLGADPGMAGVTRVGRLPGFVNGKDKYKDKDGKPYIIKMHYLLPEVRYTCRELMIGFGLKMEGKKALTKSVTVGTPKDVQVRIDGFESIIRFLAMRKMLKKGFFDRSGWCEIHCPWSDEHTNKADTGAAIREPSDENGWYGAFKCHHGHCQDKGWFDVTEWASQEALESLEHWAKHDPGFDAVNQSETLK